MKRFFVIALAGAVGFLGVTETSAPAAAAETANPGSIDSVRADAMARLNAGDIQTVDRRGRGRGGWGTRGRGAFNAGPRGGRGWRGDRGWRGGRHYGRGGWNNRRYYYGRRHRHGGNGLGYVAAGVAGLAIGSAIASNSGRGSSYCADRYRTYNPRTGTYIASGGVVRRCP